MEEYALIMRHEDGKNDRIAGTNGSLDETNNGLDRGIAAQNKFVSGTGLPFDDARVVKTKIQNLSLQMVLSAK